MPMRRWMSLGLVALAALPWSAAMTVLGLWLLTRPPGVPHAPPAPPGGDGVGWAALAGGQLVFLVCVSDRVFPRADRRITVPVEAGMALLLVLGLAAALVGVLRQGGTP